MIKDLFPLFLLFALFFSCEKKDSSSHAVLLKKELPHKDSIVPMMPADSAKLEEYTQSYEEPYAYVVSEWCSLYEDSSFHTEIGKLPFATPVKFLGFFEEITSHVTEKWQHKVVSVKFWNGEDSLIGYTLETNISFYAGRASDGNLILAGFDHYESAPLSAKLLVVDSLKRINEKVAFPIIGDYNANEKGVRYFGYYTEGKIIRDHAAGGFHDIVCIYSYYPACGYLSQEYIFNYKQQKLFPVTVCDRSSDAGYYHYGSYLIFPEEPKGKPNSILKVNHSVEYELEQEGENYSMNILEEDSCLIQLHWDNNKGLIKADTLYDDFDR